MGCLLLLELSITLISSLKLAQKYFKLTVLV
jgi:hypothetical protein